MDWAVLVSAIGGFGIGTIVSKVIDITWVQKQVEEREGRRWLRERRFKAYGALASDIESLGFARSGDGHAHFDMLAAAGPAMLLLENRELAERIREFCLELELFRSGLKEGTTDELTKIEDAGREIIEALAKEVKENK